MRIQSLRPPRASSFLLSLDFDATLYDWSSEERIPARFFDKIRQWRDEYGLLWGINTGRSYEFLKEGYEGVVNAPFAPDFLVTMERNIHLADERRYLRPLAKWNEKCLHDHHDLFTRKKAVLDSLFLELEELFSSVGWWKQEHEAYSIEVENPEDIEGIALHVDGFLVSQPELSVQRAGPYLRFCHAGYNKGTALQEVAALFGIASKRIMIMGDGHNDLDALRVHAEAMCACPANAVAPMKEVVGEREGYISPHSFSEGVIDALENHFLQLMEKKRAVK